MMKILGRNDTDQDYRVGRVELEALFSPGTVQKFIEIITIDILKLHIFYKKWGTFWKNALMRNKEL